jgi:hypothetical protein
MPGDGPKLARALNCPRFPMSSLSEADTCRKFVLPKLYNAGWDDDQIAEQRTFTDGRIVVGGGQPRRRPQKRADYPLRYRPDFTIAVLEAKASYKNPRAGIQQRSTTLRSLVSSSPIPPTARGSSSTTSSPVGTTTAAPSPTPA